MVAATLIRAQMRLGRARSAQSRAQLAALEPQGRPGAPRAAGGDGGRPVGVARPARRGRGGALPGFRSRQGARAALGRRALLRGAHPRLAGGDALLAAWPAPRLDHRRPAGGPTGGFRCPRCCRPPATPPAAWASSCATTTTTAAGRASSPAWWRAASPYRARGSRGSWRGRESGASPGPGGRLRGPSAGARDGAGRRAGARACTERLLSDSGIAFITVGLGTANCVRHHVSAWRRDFQRQPPLPSSAKMRESAKAIPTISAACCSLRVK
jgi:hypothetical protein